MLFDSTIFEDILQFQLPSKAKQTNFIHFTTLQQKSTSRSHLLQLPSPHPPPPALPWRRCPRRPPGRYGPRAPRQQRWVKRWRPRVQLPPRRHLQETTERNSRTYRFTMVILVVVLVSLLLFLLFMFLFLFLCLFVLFWWWLLLLLLLLLLQLMFLLAL